MGHLSVQPFTLADVTTAMISPPPSLARLVPTGALLAVALFAAGCASDDGRPAHGAKAYEHFPTMAGHEAFFKGSVTAEVLVGAMTGFDLEAPGAGGDHGGGGHKRRVGGGGMRMSGTMGAGMSAGGPEMRLGDNDGDVPGRQQAMVTRRADRMGSPPVMIHLRFINNGTEKTDIVIADFLSPLGNFVVQPEKFTLQPGEAIAAEPMTSRLAGEPSGGAISLSLKVGGVTETKVIALELQPEPPAPPEAKPN